MKKSILILAFAIVLGSSSFSSELKTDFCDGWETGHCEGWRDVRGQFSICPVTPVCPIPEVGKDTYNAGYNRGFKAGKKAAE